MPAEILLNSGAQKDRIDLIGSWSGSVLAAKRHGPLHLLQFS